MEVIYELDFSLGVINASYGGRYWDEHQALEREGKLGHARAQCPDRDGPREVLVWTPSAGWTAQRLR